MERHSRLTERPKGRIAFIMIRRQTITTTAAAAVAVEANFVARSLWNERKQ